jgi:glycolate oxidase iron-sulfur subunit
MQHRIPLESLPPGGRAMARAVETCVHCGFCLPSCPTYRVLGEEMDSPRGRIVLMKQVLEGDLPARDVLPYIDRCLGCLGCETSCPSGVHYRDLLIPFRAKAEVEARSRAGNWRSRMLLRLLESPGLFRLAVFGGRLARHAGPLLPVAVRPMLRLLPASLELAHPMPRVVKPSGVPRARVALLSGCVQQVLAPDINHATLRVLEANGVEVVVPPNQGCCGALAGHAGHADHARVRGEQLLRAFPSDVDAIVTNTAGCGSAMKDYGALFADTPLADDAKRFAARVRDVSELLDGLGLTSPLALPSAMTVAYHDACHLSHAQQVRAAPRRLLGAVGNLTVREVPDGDNCCGSAGLYNLEQPEIAEKLGDAKARAAAATGADAVVAGNVGCLVQIAAHLERTGHQLPVLHTMQLLDRALLNRHLSPLASFPRRSGRPRLSAHPCGTHCESAAD